MNEIKIIAFVPFCTFRPDILQRRLCWIRFECNSLFNSFVKRTFKLFKTLLVSVLTNVQSDTFLTAINHNLHSFTRFSNVHSIKMRNCTRIVFKTKPSQNVYLRRTNDFESYLKLFIIIRIMAADRIRAFVQLCSLWWLQ